jgi:hypothetical protein
MNTRRSRALAALALATTLAASAVPAARARTAIVDRFTPDSGGFPLYAPAPVLPHPSGDYFFALVASRLLCTVDATTGALVTSLDLGLDAFEAIERQPIAPMTLSDDGKVLALAAAGAVRFFDVAQGGRLTPRSAYPAPTGTPASVGLSADGTLAVFASGPTPASLTSVRTSDAKRLDTVALSSDEAPIHSLYASDQGAISVVTAHAVLIYRHDERGKLKQTGQYSRDGFVGDAFSGIEALGARGRLVYTIEEGGSALIGLNLKGKQATRAAAHGTDRFSSPIAVSADNSKIAVVAVSGQTGNPTAIVVFRGQGRSLKGSGIEIALDGSLGPVAQMAFDLTGEFLAVSFPASGTVMLVDADAKTVIGTTTSVGAAGGLAWATTGRALFVSGAATAGVVAILPVSHRGFDESAATRFERLPGVLFGPGDRALAFANRFYGIASSGSAGAIWSFNASSGSVLERVDVGRSTGLLAVAPDGRTIVASGGGGLQVFSIDDGGHLTARGSATPGAVPPDVAPSVAFHPTRSLAYVTAGAMVWRVDLVSGASEPFAIGNDGSTLTNPAVNANLGTLYAIEDGVRLVRCLLDSDGGVSLVDRKALDVTLDERAPRVAYDATASHMWAAGDSVVRQYSLFTGREENESEAVTIGRSVVLIAPDLLAAIPDGVGVVVFFALGAGPPQVVAQAELADAPTGGEPAVDPVARRIFLPLARSVVAVGADGSVTTLDDSSSALHVSFATPIARLVYPDFARFPGSVAVAHGF